MIPCGREERGDFFIKGSESPSCDTSEVLTKRQGITLRHDATETRLGLS